MRKKRQTASSIAKAAVQEVKDSAKDILNTTIVEKAKETVKDAAEKGLNGTIRIYLNVAQMAAYYTVDEKGSDEYKVDFVRI